jgi:predicted ArsR family transcriptional regulator
MDTDSVRQRILVYLNNHPTAVSKELSDALGVTQSDIRYHLTFLLQTGQVEVVFDPHHQAASSGRPARHFRLPQRTRPSNLPIFARLLLQNFIEMHAVHPVYPDPHSAYQKLAELLFSSFAPISGPISRRMAKILPQLAQWNYQPSWEARAQGPCLIFKNCPYAEIWHDYPDLCSMDHHLLEKLTGYPVTKLRNIDPSRPDATLCMFQVRLNDASHQP